MTKDIQTLQDLANRCERISASICQDMAEAGQEAHLLHVVATCGGYVVDFNAPLQARREIKSTARALGAFVTLQTI